MNEKRGKRLQPITGSLGATIMGPTNPELEIQNPDILVPPRTDHGTLSNLKWSFADSHMRIAKGVGTRNNRCVNYQVLRTMAGVICVSQLE